MWVNFPLSQLSLPSPRSVNKQSQLITYYCIDDEGGNHKTAD